MDFWIGNNRITIHEGRNDYVISVYAIFSLDPYSSGDISSHSYLNFHSLDEDFVGVNNEYDKGRITGITQTGELVSGEGVSIQLEFKGQTRDVPVYVEPPLNMDYPRSIVELVYGSGIIEGRYNILIVSEGFTLSERNIFEVAVAQMAQFLMEHPSSSPFNLLEDKFNIWQVFDPSSERGITIARPVSIVNGTVRTNMHIDPFSNRDIVLTQAKDSKFGLTYSTRFGDVRSFFLSQITRPHLRDWYRNYDPLTFPRDLRRRNLDRNWFGFWNDYVDTLRINEEIHRGGLSDNFDSSIWKWTEEEGGTEGKDKRLVCFLINEDLSIAQGKKQIHLPLRFGRGHIIRNVERSSSVTNSFDHQPTDIEIVFANSEESLPMLRLRSGVTFHYANTFVHELGHPLGLGDEYSGGNVLESTNLGGIDLINSYPNLIHRWNLLDTTDAINLRRIPWWEIWKRVERSSSLNGPAQNLEDRIIVPAARDSIFDWLIPAPVDYSAALVYLRTREINYVPEPEGTLADIGALEGPFQILEISMARGEFVLRGNISNEFPEGSVIFLPKEIIDGNPTSVIRNEVAEFILRNGVFTDTQPPADLFRDLEDSDIDISDPNYVVGIYEGGAGTYSSNVYHPSGNCNMGNADLPLEEVEDQVNRSHPFCFACKYYLVNKINPELLGDIDDEYPR